MSFQIRECSVVLERLVQLEQQNVEGVDNLAQIKNIKSKKAHSKKNDETNEKANQPLTKSTPQSKRRQNQQPATSASQSLRSTSKKRGLEKQSHDSNEKDENFFIHEEVNQPLTERALRLMRRQNEQPVVSSTPSLRSRGRKRKENDAKKTNEK